MLLAYLGITRKDRRQGLAFSRALAQPNYLRELCAEQMVAEAAVEELTLEAQAHLEADLDSLEAAA
jgi:hypothetical protein